MPLKECNYPLIWLVRFRLTARKDVFTINQQLLYHCCLNINLWPTPQPRLLKTLIFERNCTPRCLYKISAAHTLYQESLKGYSFYGFCLFRKKKKKKKTFANLSTYHSLHKCTSSFRQEVQIHRHPCCLFAPGWTLFCRVLWTKAYTQVSGSGWFFSASSSLKLASLLSWSICVVSSHHWLLLCRLSTLLIYSTKSA